MANLERYFPVVRTFSSLTQSISDQGQVDRPGEREWCHGFNSCTVLGSEAKGRGSKGGRVGVGVRK